MHMLRESVLLGYFLFGVSLVLVIGENTGTTGEDDGDAIIVDAAINVDVKSRSGRHFPGYLFHPHVISTSYELPPLASSWSEPVGVGVAPSASVDEECVTGDGKAGRCTQFEACFPLRHMVEESQTNTLNEELRRGMEHTNCSSTIHAGTSNYQDICCPLIPTMSMHHRKPLVPAVSVPVLPVNIEETLFRSISSETCGRSHVASTKIVNGTNTVPGELPWMVVMFGKSGKQTCGGALVSENMVLTAAHCIATYLPTDVSKIRLFIGDYNIRTTSDGYHEVRGVKRLIKHKFFNIQTFVNDIALLRLDKPVQFNSRVQPICFPPDVRNDLVNQKLLVAGWGRTTYGGLPSPILQKVRVRVWANPSCASIYNGIAPGGILSTMICAGDKGLDSCIGDSGGPLMHKSDEGIFEQVGIVSFGKGCGTHPGVYTRLTEYLPWIATNINK